MRRINIRTGALGSVGVLVLVGCPAASATSGSSAAAHSNAIPAFVVKPQRSTADAGRAVHTPTSPARNARLVAVLCNGQGQARPARLALWCPGGNLPPGNYATDLKWQRWDSRHTARGTGTEHPATCQGSTLVAVTLWRPRRWPGHPGQRYFTRMTVLNKWVPTAWSPRTKTVHLKA
jgi:hypothetical protein